MKADEGFMQDANGQRLAHEKSSVAAEIHVLCWDAVSKHEPQEEMNCADSA